MCRKLPSDASDFVMEAVPLLTNLLNYHDAKVLLMFEILILSWHHLSLRCSYSVSVYSRYWNTLLFA